MTDITAKLAEALREAEDALASSYQVVDFPANGASQQDKALASVRAALSALPAPADDGWMPIETAPKDGRSLMVWVAGDKIAGPHVLAPISITVENAWWDDATCERIEPLGSVTHWRPLPAPPAPAQEPRS